MLTPSKAFEIASQWGSLIRAGDPGTVFYTFPLNDARPLSEAHRAECLAYLSDLLSEETGGDAETRERAAELAALQTFFRDSPIGDGVSKPEAPNAFHLDTSGAVKPEPDTDAGEFVAAHYFWSDLDAFTQGYIKALFFTEGDDLCREWESTESECDAALGFADLAPEALARIIADCAKFQVDVIKPINQAIGFASLETDDGQDYTPARAGHDFWLTRNGHGAGFWDRGLPADLGETLSDLACGFGQVDAYLGDNGRVYL